MSKYRISDRVVFAGFYSGIDLYAWYDMANYFVLPSRYEPFGAVVNESLIYGCPVIASKYIGAIDFINSDNGQLFDPLNETEFDSVLRSACQKYAHNIVERANLMTTSFSRYVSAFKRIDEKDEN